MITQLRGVNDLPSPYLGFQQFLPSSQYIISNLSVRHDDSKWPTLRFEFSGEVSGRIKEFFLDWFYYGFPKNMMSSLVDSYSEVHVISGNPDFFYGRDYKGMTSATAFINGTCLEVEFFTGEDKGIKRFMSSLRRVGDLHISEPECRFHRLGFHASGHTGEWFEDMRIARLSWDSLYSGITIGSNYLQGSSTGVFHDKGRTVHRYSIFQEGCFERAVTLDLWDRFSDIEFLGYKLRSGGNMLKRAGRTVDGSPILSLTGSGPAIAGVRTEEIEGAVAFSLGFSVTEIKKFMDSNRKWILAQFHG